MLTLAYVQKHNKLKINKKLQRLWHTNNENIT